MIATSGMGYVLGPRRGQRDGPCVPLTDVTYLSGFFPAAQTL